MKPAAAAVDDETSLRANFASPRLGTALPWWSEWIGPAIVAATLVGVVAWSWMRWLDPVIDFGREVYTPWQLSEGRVLYRDVAAFYGPLSQYFNALLFRVFGPGLLTLVVANIVILTVAVALMYGILRSLSTRLAAAVGTLMFVLLSGVAHIGAVGNFNFITPYSHEATHGFVLSLAGLVCLLRWGRTGGTPWAGGMGLCLGLVFLTKPEIFVALAGAMAVGMAANLWKQRGKRLMTVGMVAGAALAPVAAMWGFLALQMTPGEALGGVLGAWRYLFNSELVHSDFYANSLGMKNPASQVQVILKTAACFAVLLAPAAVAGLLMKDGSRGRRMLAVAAGLVWLRVALGLTGVEWGAKAGEVLLLMTLAAAVAGLLMKDGSRGRRMLAVAAGLVWLRVALGLTGVEWGAKAGEVLLLMTLAAAAGQVWGMSRRGGIAGQGFKLAVLAFGLLMMLKMLLHTRFHHYGFVLAAVPTAILVMAAVDWAPAWMEQRKRCGWAFRGAALGVLGWLTYGLCTVSAANFAAQREPIGQGRTAYYVDDRGPVFRDMVAYIEQNVGPEQTLTVMPEGAMLNVLTGRRSSVKYVTFIPSDLMMFGEATLRESLETHPPDFVAIMHRPTDEYPTVRFGIDYALTIRNWLHENYTPIHLAGTFPFSTPDEFGILLLRRNGVPSSSRP